MHKNNYRTLTALSTRFLTKIQIKARFCIVELAKMQYKALKCIKFLCFYAFYLQSVTKLPTFASCFS